MVLIIEKYFRKLHRECRGYTLIELLLVIAILALLAVIAIPVMLDRNEEARRAADLANVSCLQTAVDLYIFEREESGGTPPELDADGWIEELVAQGYLQKEVKSPYSGEEYILTELSNGNYIVNSTRTGGIADDLGPGENGVNNLAPLAGA